MFANASALLAAAAAVVHGCEVAPTGTGSAHFVALLDLVSTIEAETASALAGYEVGDDEFTAARAAGYGVTRVTRIPHGGGADTVHWRAWARGGEIEAEFDGERVAWEACEAKRAELAGETPEPLLDRSPRVVVWVRGGIVQEVEQPQGSQPVMVMVIDSDVDDDCTTEVRDGDKWSRASVSAYGEPQPNRGDWPEVREVPEDDDDAEPAHRDEVRAGEFSRSTLAGYTVEPDTHRLGFEARDAEGAEVADGWFTTERAAWEACDRHRMFGEPAPRRSQRAGYTVPMLPTSGRFEAIQPTGEPVNAGVSYADASEAWAVCDHHHAGTGPFSDRSNVHLVFAAYPCRDLPSPVTTGRARGTPSRSTGRHHAPTTTTGADHMTLATLTAANVLAFTTTTGALDAYRMARMTGTPSDYRDAAHKLASALQAEMAKPRLSPGADVATPDATGYAPGLDVSSAKPKRTRKAKGEDMGLDLSTPLGSIPRAKSTLGEFVVTWADGSTTTLRNVQFHVSKPDSRWIAAAQTGDRHRRLMARKAYLAEMDPFGAPYSIAVGVQVVGMMGMIHDSDEWVRLNKVRPMAPLALIQEVGPDGEVVDTFTAVEGSTFGAGDREEAMRLEGFCFAPIHPLIARVPTFDVCGPLVHITFPSRIARLQAAVQTFTEHFLLEEQQHAAANPVTAAEGAPITDLRAAHLKPVVFSSVGAEVALERLREEMVEAVSGRAIAFAHLADHKAAHGENLHSHERLQLQEAATSAAAVAKRAEEALEGGRKRLALLRQLGEGGRVLEFRRSIGGREFDVTANHRCVTLPAVFASAIALAA